MSRRAFLGSLPVLAILAWAGACQDGYSDEGPAAFDAGTGTTTRPADGSPVLDPVVNERDDDLDAAVLAPDDDAAPPSCVAKPLAVFVPLVPDASNLVCNQGGLLDGGTVGLDVTPGMGAVPLDTELVTSCVAVDFGDQRLVDRITVTASSSAASCGNACNKDCNTGHSFGIFAASTPSASAFKFLGRGSLGELGIKRTTSALVPTSVTGRYAAVCRMSYGSARDDVNVHAIVGRCK